MLVEIGGIFNSKVDVEALGKGLMEIIGKGLMEIIGVVVAVSFKAEDSVGVGVGVGVAVVKTMPNLF